MHKFKWWKRKNSDERSSINGHLPRYHNGYDIDRLLEKDHDGKDLTSKEIDVLEDVILAYYNQESENRKKGLETNGPLMLYGKKVYPSGTRIELRRPISMFHINSDERSLLNNHLPKYYNGYDVDELFEKQSAGHLSKKEIEIIDEIVREYYAERLKNKKDGKCAYGPLTINGIQIFPRGTVIERSIATEYHKKYGGSKDA